MSQASTTSIDPPALADHRTATAQALVEDRGGRDLVAPGERKVAWRPLPAGIVHAARRRIGWRGWAFIALVVLPVAAACVYFGAIASDQYVSEFRFSLRNAAPIIPTGTGQAMSVSAASISPTIVWDSQAVVQYLKSRDVVDDLGEDVDIRRRYATDSADYLARLRPSAPIEAVVKYWNRMVNPFFDYMTGVITVDVRAFRPDDAQVIAAAILRLAEKRVNAMSDRASLDLVSTATAEQEKAEAMLIETEKKVKAFRNAQGIIDPKRQAELTIVSQGKLRDELATMQARYDSLRSYLSADAPSLKVLRSEIEATQSAIHAEQSDLTRAAPTVGTPDSPSASPELASVIGQYESLLVEQTFREKAYLATQEALAKARSEADRQHLYLNAFVLPKVPEVALYPQRIQSVLLVLLGGMLAWVLTVLLVYSIRDHI